MPMKPKTKARANAALLPTVEQILAMYASGYRGKAWHNAFARLKTTAALVKAQNNVQSDL